MTDDEIIKALTCCKTEEPNCDECPYDYPAECYIHLKQDAFDLIQRQLAEIDKLHQTNFNLIKSIGDLVELTRVEAIEEFVDKLKARKAFLEDNDVYYIYVTTEEIDNLVAEMVGADNG